MNDEVGTFERYHKSDESHASDKEGVPCAQIKQHAPSLKVVIYDGLKASSKAAADDTSLSPESKKRKRSKMTKRQKIEFAQVGVCCNIALAHADRKFAPSDGFLPLLQSVHAVLHAWCGAIAVARNCTASHIAESCHGQEITTLLMLEVLAQ